MEMRSQMPEWQRMMWRWWLETPFSPPPPPAARLICKPRFLLNICFSSHPPLSTKTHTLFLHLSISPRQHSVERLGGQDLLQALLHPAAEAHGKVAAPLREALKVVKLGAALLQHLPHIPVLHQHLQTLQQEGLFFVFPTFYITAQDH